MYYIGIDLGTSAMKLLLVDEAGTIKRSVTREYPLSMPHPGWSEQNPMDWWSACLIGAEELLSGIDRSQVAGIGCGGQMHGLVVLDSGDEIIRDAILWNDGRTSEEVEYLNDTVGRDVISGYTANIAFAGFTAPKLLWMKKHEPENFARISKIMLPKDYINYKLTGVHSCDYSDASGMLLLDVRNRRWSREMLDICSVREDQMPSLFESYEVIGTLKPEIATALSLPAGVRVVAGAGDNAAAAVGTGTVGDGNCNISIGTSGTVFISSEVFGQDMDNALHSFAHADGNYHLMGCMLSAASCNKWFCDEIIREKDYQAVQDEIDPARLGENEVFFLPYLMGERSPINDTDARGVFMGMSMNTTRADMAQAVLEGVAFAIRDNIEIARSVGIRIERSKICGGGARSRLWQTIFSSVLNIPLDIPVTEEGPGYGGAMLAMVGTGLYPDVKKCAEALTRVKDTVYPDPVLAEKYSERYAKYRKIYPALRDVFKEMRK